jgi:hypothetical protein
MNLAGHGDIHRLILGQQHGRKRQAESKDDREKDSEDADSEEDSEPDDGKVTDSSLDPGYEDV